LNFRRLAASIILLEKRWFSRWPSWTCRKLRCGAPARDRPAGLPRCCRHEMLRSWKPMPENAKTAPAQPRLKAPGPICVQRSTSNGETTRILDRLW